MGAKTERPTGKDLGASDLEEKQNENQKLVGFKILKYFWKKNLLLSSYISLNRVVQNKTHMQTTAFSLQCSEYDKDVKNQDSVKELFCPLKA